MDNRDICKRFDQLAADRTTIQQIWDAIEALVTPYRGRFFEDIRTEHGVEWLKASRQVYDSTAVMAHQNLAASLHGSLTSPSIQWFDLRFSDHRLNKQKAAAMWLQAATESIHAALDASNFGLQINETYQDLCGFGTAIITLEEEGEQGGEWGGLRFASVPLKEAYFEPDFMGGVLRFYRLMEWTPAQILSRFGDNVPQKVRDMDEKGNQQKLTVLFVIIPRANKTVAIGDTVAPEERPWEYRYILKDSHETLGTPGGYYEMSAFAPRWRVTSGSVWGNSPAMAALGDILTLNAARKLQLEAAEKLISPPIFAEERAIVGDLDIRAGAMSVVRNMDGIQPFSTGANIPVSDMMIQQLQAAIRNYFFTDQINYPDPQAQPMTATEAQIRYELMQRLLGPTLGRIQSDLLSPVVSRAFRMLVRAGVLEPPPDIVRQAGAQFEIEYMGALVRAQRVDNAAAIERFITVGATLAEIFPEMLDVIDADAAIRQIGRDLNVPAAAMRDARQVQDMREDREEQQAQAQQAIMAEQQGKGMEAMGKGEAALREVGGENARR